MSPRAVIRSVEYRIIQHPDIGLTYGAACLSCGWAAKPSPSGDAVDKECCVHHGRSGHRGFRLMATSFACVIRDGE